MEISNYKLVAKEAIIQLYANTFSDSEGEEAGLSLGSLVTDLVSSTKDQNLYGFVAHEGETVIGCIFFSRLVYESGIDAFLMSPVATHTRFQGQGVGQKLIAFGLNSLKESGVKLVVTYGDPNFYSKVGFAQISEDILRAPHVLCQPEGWLGQSLVSDVIEPIGDKPRCVEAFDKPEMW